MQGRIERLGTFRAYSRAERVADLSIHLLGVGGAIAGVMALAASVLPRGADGEILSLSLYCGGLLAMMTLSAAYHHLARTPFAKGILQRFDRAAIFTMIAGTYTPFALLRIGGTAGSALLVFVWGLALVGVGFTLFAPRAAARVSIALYLAMGWSMLPVLGELFGAVAGPVAVLVVVGGVIYTGGVVFHLWERLRFHNAIWHACVLAGAVCHYAAVYTAFALSGGGA
jgi:hemolysin III